MAGFRLDWKGNNIKGRKDQAVKDGIDMTTAAAVTVAQSLAPRDTGFMANTIEFQNAKKEGNRIVGRWGNWTALYTLWQEIGSRGRPGRYFLRRAADREYPNLFQRIRAAARW